MPTTPIGPSRRNLLRMTVAVGGAVALGGVGSIVTASRAQAAQPQLYTREDWGARPPRNPIEVLPTPPDTIVVHHTASENTPDTSLEQAFALSRWIQDLHMDDNGWSDSGQQLTISRGGYLMEGRDRSLEAIESGQHVVGAHVGGENSHTIGIENEGIYVSVDVPDALWQTLVETCRWLCDAYGLDPATAIAGHRDFNATQCPGDVLYGRLPELREQVAGLLG